MKADGGTDREADRAGIYIHVPFCRQRCHFCSFKITTHRDFEDGWFAGVLAETNLRAPDWTDREFDTVYFGGGTPSLVDADRIVSLLEHLRRTFRIAHDSEITLEVNPGDLEPTDLDVLRAAGVNRLSIGVQSFDDGDLAFLTRHHSGAEGADAIRWAKAAGFPCLTVDLLYGIPGRRVDGWKTQIDRAAEFGVEHISAYMLTIEPGTPFGAWKKRGALKSLSEEDEREMFIITRDLMREADYEPYEVSSYARDPSLQSRHNRKYWECAPYLGLGPAAHSYDGTLRSWNEAATRTYAARLAAGEDPVAGSETLSEEDRRLERLFLGLRTARGVPRDLVADRRDTVENLLSEGLAVFRGDSFVLTDEGFAVADAIAAGL